MKKYLSDYPHLIKEWHPTKNGELKPVDLTHGSNKKVWWLCSKGHSHYSTISNRTSKNSTGCPEGHSHEKGVNLKVHHHSCPYCLGRKTLNYDLFK